MGGPSMPGRIFKREAMVSEAVRVGLMSDTHGFLDSQVLAFFAGCDQVWHAGDIGRLELARELESFAPLRAVWGNIDGPEIRDVYPEVQRFSCGGVKVMMIHIGGYPGRYAKGVGAMLKADTPDLFVCGHSHILKVMPCPRFGLLHINPGACGRQGFHLEKTVVRFTLEAGKMKDLQIGKLGAR
jgi:putative phosphoesterase